MLSQCPYAYCDHNHGVVRSDTRNERNDTFGAYYSASSFGTPVKSALAALVSEPVPFMLPPLVDGRDLSDDDGTDSENGLEEKEVIPNGTKIEIREFDWVKLRWGAWSKGTVISHTFNGIMGCTLTELYGVRTGRADVWVSPELGSLRDGRLFMPSDDARQVLERSLVYAYIPAYNRQTPGQIEAKNAVWVPAFLTWNHSSTKPRVIPLIRSRLDRAKGPSKMHAQDILPYDNSAGAKLISMQGGRVYPDPNMHPKEFVSIDDVAEFFGPRR